MSPSRITDAWFVAIVVAVFALFVYAVQRTKRRGHPDRAGIVVSLTVVALWLAVPAILASRGVLDRYTPLPAPALIVIALITLGTIGLASSPLGARLATGIPLAGLVGYQAFRVAVELVLHRLYSEGAIPIQMTYSGRNFDIVGGLLAALLACWLWSGRGTKRLVTAWNIMGLALLLNIVTIAVLSTPVPFRYFMNDPANLLPSTFPYVWLPTFLVQAALFGHLLVFRAIETQLGTAAR